MYTSYTSLRSLDESLAVVLGQEVREFVTTETADVCAFLEERLEEFASQQPASAAEDAKSPSGDASQALALQTAGGSGQVSWSGASGQWGPAGGAEDGAFLTQMPRNVQELWHYLQRGMQHVEVRSGCPRQRCAEAACKTHFTSWLKDKQRRCADDSSDQNHTEVPFSACLQLCSFRRNSSHCLPSTCVSPIFVGPCVLVFRGPAVHFAHPHC